MASKKCIYWVAGFVGSAAAFGMYAVFRYANADMYEFDLRNETPTVSVAVSKSHGLYITDVKCEPGKFMLNGKAYRISGAWIEHRTEPERISMFTTRQAVLADMVLCVSLKVEGANGWPMFELRIKNAKTEHIHADAGNNVLFNEIGRSIPSSIEITGGDTAEKVEIRLSYPDSVSSRR